jgi:polar amino acid transport system permease protein
MAEIIHNFFNWQALLESVPLLVAGLVVTVKLSVTCMFSATVIGLLVGALRYRNYRFVNWCLVAYVDVLRAVPPIVLLIFVYYALPFVGVELSPYPAAIVSLSLYVGAYVSEIVRAGLEAIPQGQHDAARALGLPYWQVLRYVVLPQAIRVAIPPLTSELMGLVKLTSVAFVVALPELLNNARIAQNLTANSTPLVGASGIYLLVLLTLARFARIIERLLQRRGGYKLVGIKAICPAAGTLGRPAISSRTGGTGAGNPSHRC